MLKSVSDRPTTRSAGGAQTLLGEASRQNRRESYQTSAGHRTHDDIWESRHSKLHYLRNTQVLATDTGRPEMVPHADTKGRGRGPLDKRTSPCTYTQKQSKWIAHPHYATHHAIKSATKTMGLGASLSRACSARLAASHQNDGAAHDGLAHHARHRGTASAWREGLPTGHLAAHTLARAVR